MRCLRLLLSLFSMQFNVFIICLIIVSGPTNCQEDADQLWADFKLKYNKKFDTTKHEELRKSIFLDHLQMIKTHNEKYAQGNTSYMMGINALADLTNSEYILYMSVGPELSQCQNDEQTLLSIDQINGYSVDNIPVSWDWRKQGKETPVEDQTEFCSSSWAFAATGLIENYYSISNNLSIKLSEQELIDCTANDYGYNGCNGGLITNALKFATKYGLESETSYPYIAADTKRCKMGRANIVAKIRGYKKMVNNNADPIDENWLKWTVHTKGPVAVIMDTSLDSFRFYKLGIYDDADCSDQSAYGYLLIIGYGTINGQDYWLLKNSYSSGWGEAGYIRVARKDNLCGISNHPYFPII